MKLLPILMLLIAFGLGCVTSAMIREGDKLKAENMSLKSQLRSINQDSIIVKYLTDTSFRVRVKTVARFSDTELINLVNKYQ